MFKKIIDGLILFANLFGMIMLIIVFVNSLSYWNSIISGVNNIKQLMFDIGIMVAITYGLMGFIEIFIKEFGVTYKAMFKKK